MKYFKYLKYVLKHKWYVFVECCNLGIPWRGIIHDISKLLPSEFFAYANWFYGKKDACDYMEDRIAHNEYLKAEFDIAWLKHQHRNPHHWQHYILRKDDGGFKVLDMPEKVIEEMFADWVGAGRAIHGKNDAFEWYKKNENKIILSENTKEILKVIMFKYQRGF